VFLFNMYVFLVFVRSVSGVVFGVLLSYVRGKFRPVGGAPGFDFLDLFLGEFRNFSGSDLFHFFRFFRFIVVKFGATDDGIDFRYFRGLFLLGFDETGGKGGDLIVV
jgi:hypothetical protein